MPERPLAIASYALGASLCAISLLYVFGPSFAFDAEVGSTTKRRIVGLENPANICFCNSVLQALSNSPELRIYLIRETHRRRLDGKNVYVSTLPEEKESRKEQLARRQQDNLRNGIVTHALKAMLDKLNERPLQRKTISAQKFIEALEVAFGTNISRAQQDAQEFLQVIVERLAEEYQAGVKARKVHEIRLRAELESVNGDVDSTLEKKAADDDAESPSDFPFEGKIESQIECKTCGFKPKPAVSVFVNLTLHVPQKSSTTLNDCFDGYLKDEKIDGFKCDKCRLIHAKHVKEVRFEKSQDPAKRSKLAKEVDIIEAALEEDPERDIPEAHLPDIKHAPTGTIIRHMRIAKFPRVLAIHLSRSIYSSYSTKNAAKVSFPETLSIGGLLDTHSYKLSGLVMHKGGHNSGHYETFRRQVPAVPFSTPFSFGTHGVYSRQNSPTPSSLETGPDETITPLPLSPEPPESRGSSPAVPSRSSSQRSSSKSSHSSLSRSISFMRPKAPTSAPRIADTETEKDASASTLAPEIERLERKRRKLASRWWRVSDDKVRESKTSDVLSMQKEVYLLFYEIDSRPT
jgi:ubiquitin carboxyl-terminal hydrolase 16